MHGRGHRLEHLRDLYGAEWVGEGQEAPSGQALRDQFAANLNVALDVLRNDDELVTYLADRLVEIGDSVPEEIEGFRLPVTSNPLNDADLLDVTKYPESMWAKPGDKKPNRAALARWGSWINAVCRERYGRPQFLACSADLAGSTNIEGFAKDYDDLPGYGWYERDTKPEGVMLPQEITEFGNAGLMVGAASVNLSDRPEEEFNGFWTACSTYGAFSYLKYGAMRLYSQLAADSELKVGKVVWVAGHSGPETAEDSRTHFGIFSPGVTSLFPDGHVINIHPWEYNEVPVMLAAALKVDRPIVVLHLTRPGIEIPNREALGLASHFEAAKGAYVLRDYKEGPRHGCLFVHGTMSTHGLLQALPEIDAAGVNVKLVAVPSPQLFALQDEAYREATITPADRMNSTFVTNGARRLMSDWTFNPLAGEYAMSSDFDDEWRVGGSVPEVCEDAHIDPASLRDGVLRFARDYEQRMERLQAMLGAAAQV